MGLVATTAIFPGVGYLWKSSASSSVKVCFSLSLIGPVRRYAPREGGPGAPQPSRRMRQSQPRWLACPPAWPYRHRMANSSPVRIGIAGALGRMGRAVAAAVEQRAGAEFTALFDAPGTEGQIAEHEGGRGRVLVTRDEALAKCDAIIDFTIPDATAALARLAAERGGPALILGSTGLGQTHRDAIHAAANRVAVVHTGNFSLGVNVLTGLVRQVAERLGPDAW